MHDMIDFWLSRNCHTSIYTTSLVVLSKAIIILVHCLFAIAPYATIVTIVFVVKDTFDLFDDLLDAAQSSLGFWNNPLDNEDWN